MPGIAYPQKSCVVCVLLGVHVFQVLGFKGKAKCCHIADLKEEGVFFLLHLFILCTAHFVTLAICFSF